MYHYFTINAWLNTDELILRQFLIRSDLTFADLHEAIQDAMLWQRKYHYWFGDFYARSTAQASIGDSRAENPGIPIATEVPLSAWETIDPTIRTYGYGRASEWRVALDRPTTVDLPDRFDRRMLAGRGGYAPEDCGGPLGYSNLIRIMVTHGPKTKRDRALAEIWNKRDDWQHGAFILEKVGPQFDR